MKTLTKTEQVLLERAARTGRGGVTSGYRTGRKNGGYGGRESAALGKLVRAGLVRIVSQQSHADSRCRYSDHWHETVYEIISQASAN